MTFVGLVQWGYQLIKKLGYPVKTRFLEIKHVLVFIR